MSLHGTLGDFGIADIFQLIGHQAKTGVLLLKDREVEVRIFFVDGNVVKAEQSSREKAFLLGNLMVRAQVLTQAQLDEALATQQRTLRRLGDILVDMGAVDRATLKEFARLQTTETIYRLFAWRAGTYEFKPEAVDYDEGSYEPIRSENILMEGFRMVDEWPAVRRVVPSADCSFLVLRDLPPPPAHDDDDDILAGMKDAFEGPDSGEHSGPSTKPLGAAERAVFPHVVPGRTVIEIVDRARLGEFETTKALANLVGNGVLKVVKPTTVEKAAPLKPSAVAQAAVPFVMRLVVFALVAALVGVLVRVGSSVDGGVFTASQPQARRAALIDEEGEQGLLRLRAALDLYRVQEGRYPKTLDELVQAGLIDERALRFPYATPYAYRVHAADAADAGGVGGYDLALPLY